MDVAIGESMMIIMDFSHDATVAVEQVDMLLPFCISSPPYDIPLTLLRLCNCTIAVTAANVSKCVDYSLLHCQSLTSDL